MSCKTTFHIMNRRTFLRLVAHLSVLSTTLLSKHATTARALQAMPLVNNYGSGRYGQGIYVGSDSFGSGPVEHQIYLPIVSKEDM